MKKVIVPLDGSKLAEAALAPAHVLAGRTDAELVLVTTRWSVDDVEEPGRYLDQQRRELDRPADAVVILDRDAPSGIVLATDEPGALVCMATHGRGGVKRAVLGSVAEAVVRGAHSPVLLVGPEVSPQWSLPEHPTLLLGIDGSEHSLAVVPAAVDLALAVTARARIVDVSRPPDVLAVSRFRTDDVDVLESVTTRLGSHGVPADYEVVDGLDAAETLLSEAATLRASIIVIATHGRRGLARAALGSVAMRVVHGAPCPVLVVRPQPGPPSEAVDAHRAQEAPVQSNTGQDGGS